MKYDYAIGKRLFNYTSTEAKTAGCADGQYNEAQCATSVSGASFFHGYTGATVRGNAKDRLYNAKSAGYKTGTTIKSWSWICYGNGNYGHIKFCYEVDGNYAIIAEANSNGNGYLDSSDMLVKKVTVASLKTASYQGCVYLADTFPKVTPKNLNYNYDIYGNKTKLSGTSSSSTNKTNTSEKLLTFKVNCSSGLNYRSEPNGKYIGTFNNKTVVKVVKGWGRTTGGFVWYKIKLNNKYYYVAAKYLTYISG